MVVGMLVNRDFEENLAKFGDVVNTRRPGEFVAYRKTNADSVTIQDATAVNVPVTLNQQVHVSFLIKDGEESFAFQDLVATYLAPAMLAQARFVDQVLLGQYAQFLNNSYGSLGSISSTTALPYILGVRGIMNKNKAYAANRNLIWTPDGETAALGTELFIAANLVGDDGTALREASMGRKLGLNHFMSQNMASIGPVDSQVCAVINAGNLAAKSTVLTLTSGAHAIPANSWITVDTDGTPLRVVTSTGGATPTAVTVTAPGLRNAITNGSSVRSVIPGLTDGTTYAIGYPKGIGYTGFTNEPQNGQLVTFGTDPTSPVYTIIRADTVNNLIYLDRPTEATISATTALNLGPSGNYNLAFHRNAISLVTRPLAMPKAGTGALSSVVNYNGFSMRATITYQGLSQGHLVTLDMLMGVAILDNHLGAVLLG